MIWLKNDHFRLGLIIGLFILSVLVASPRIPIKFNLGPVNVDTHIGGYYFSLFGDRIVLDLVNYKKGLDLEGGVKIVLKADMEKIPEVDRAAALASAKEIIDRRVNYLGVSEPYVVPVQTGDEYRIIVEIPGVDDLESALSLVGSTAQISFKELTPETPWDGTQFEQYFFSPDSWTETGLTGSDLHGAELVYSQAGVGFNQGSTAPQIQLRFSNEGRKKFSEVAKKNVDKPIGIFLDDSPVPLSMPVVSSEFVSGVVGDPVISGNFDVETATNLTLQIRAGALPVSVEVLQQEKIGATLGSDSVRASFTAGIVGFILIMIFMFLLYGKLGLIADFALILYALLVLSIFKIVPVVLTLPGIAGFLLSVGMAVDANILIFERTNEELRAGRPRSLAIKLGFERAWSSIRDSNVSSLITATILFYLGTGAIRGFAVTLFIGIIVSLFTAIFVVETLIRIAKLDADPTVKHPLLRRLLRK